MTLCSHNGKDYGSIFRWGNDKIISPPKKMTSLCRLFLSGGVKRFRHLHKPRDVLVATFASDARNPLYNGVYFGGDIEFAYCHYGHFSKD